MVERLDPGRHNCAGFACGNPALDTYLHDRVLRDEDEHSAIAYVLVDSSEPAAARRVIGYFTLNSFSFPRKQARRRDQDKHLGGYDPVPAVLIGRLALDSGFQGRGLGSVLLVSALNRIFALSAQLGIAVVVVHAIDDDAAAFYQHQGFTRFRDEPGHLYYPLATFEAALVSSRRPDR